MTGVTEVSCAGSITDGGTTSSGVKAPDRVCRAPITRVEIPCQTEDGYWSDTYHCYVRPYTGDDYDQRAADLDMPPTHMLATCTRAEGDDSERVQVIVIPRSEADPPPDPRTIAWQLVAQLNLRAGRIGLVPTSEHSLLGLPTWLWIANPGPRTTGPISDSTTVRGHTVTIEAHLSKVVYDMGDGTTVTCAGTNAAGTPYHVRYGTKPSPTCGHLYTEAGSHTVTATAHWTIDWYGIGRAGTLTLTLHRSVQNTIHTGHSVNR